MREPTAPRRLQNRAAWLLGALACWALARGLPLWLHAGGIGGNDVRIYSNYARDWWQLGLTPYAGFRLEYPPGALFIFAAPSIAAHIGIDYAHAFAAEMALFDLALFALVFACARRLHPESRRRPAIAAGLYLLASEALFPELYSRYDLASAALVLSALYFTYRPRREWLGALLLGLGGAVKLWPLALVPLWMLVAWRRGGAARALRCALCVAAGLVAPALPFLWSARLHVLNFLQYHLDRGVQIESVFATWLFLAGQARDSRREITFGHGALELHGDLAHRFAELSTPLLLLLALLPQLLALRALRRGARLDERLGLALAVGCATALGFVVGGKVLSPQFILWIAPLLALLADGPLAAGALLCLAALTTAIFPVLYDGLQHERDPRRPWAVAALCARNLLLIASYLSLLWRISRAARQPDLAPAAQAAAEPASAAGPAGAGALPNEAAGAGESS